MKSARILTLVLVLCMVSVCFLSGTVAKYTSTGTGTDTASVAKWKFTVEGTDIATTDEWTFDLFNTVANQLPVGSNPIVDDTNVNNAADSNAATSQIIAPGTVGFFVIDLENASEVNAKYGISFTYTEKLDGAARAKKIPIQFSLDGTNWENTIEALDFGVNKGAGGTDTSKAIPTQQADAVNYQQTVTVYWKWAYEVDEAGNIADTNLGTEAYAKGLTIEISATVTAIQVDYF